MKKEHLVPVITVAFALIALLTLVVWLNTNPGLGLQLRVPTTPANLLEKLAKQKINFKGLFVQGIGKPSLISGSWSKFRGNDSDNIYKENIGLLDKLQPDKLPVLWKIKLGDGYAGPAVRNGSVYIIDYDKDKQSDVLRRFSLDSGAEIWHRAYVVAIKPNHGMSRTIPAVTKKYVVSIGPRAQVLCLDSLTGNFLWGIDLPLEYGSVEPLWYMGQCPLIDNNTAVIAACGKVLMLGINCSDGKVLWQIPNPDKWNMSHSSIIPMALLNKKMFVYCAIGGMIGVSAEKEDSGKVLWKTKDWNQSIVCPSPVQVGNDKIFMTSGYGAGSKMFQIMRTAAGFSIKALFSLTKEQFASEVQTPIYYQNHLYTVMPADAGALNRQLVCMTSDAKINWSSGADNRYGLGSYIIADGKIYLLDDNGVLTIVKADPQGFVRLAKVKILQGVETWSPIAIVPGEC